MTVFLINEAYTEYWSLMEFAKNRDRVEIADEITEKHHVIPKSLGGDDSDLVVLTLEEHLRAHRLLIDMTTGLNKGKMACAYHIMKTGRQGFLLGLDKSLHEEVDKIWKEKQRQAAASRPPISEETREKMRASAKASVKVLTDEGRKSLSESAKVRFSGVPKTEEHSEKISKALVGHVKTKEHVEKINKNPEKIAKTADKHRGMKRSKDARKKMSDAKSGVVPWNKGIKTSSGRFWSHDPKTGVSKFSNVLEDGFVRGRKSK